MSVGSIYSQYGLSVSSLYREAAGESTFSLSGGLSSAGSSLYSSVLSSTKGQAALSSALAAIQSETGSSRITFDDVEAYREKLENAFSSTIQNDLLALGVSSDVEFSLVVDSSGRLNVVSSHADKARIQQYFDANPSLADTFGQIQALANFKRNTENVEVRDWDSMRELKKGLQAQAVETFFAAAQEVGGFSPMYADYSGDTSETGSMMDYFFGVNATV